MADAQALPAAAVDEEGALRRFGWLLADSATIARRNLLYLRHNPALLLLAIIGPLGFMVVFSLLFGHAISVPGAGSYQSFILPGILAMTSVMGVLATAGSTAADKGLGVVDRLKAMPTSRAAIPLGQAAADLATSTISLAVNAGAGYALGWRPHASIGGFLGAFGLLILFRYAVTFLGVWMGLVVKDEATGQQLGPLMIGLTMWSSAFVPVSGLNSVVRTIAYWNPVSALTTACRGLFGGVNPAVSSQPWTMTHPVAATLGWCAVIFLIFAPLSIRKFAKVP